MRHNPKHAVTDEAVVRRLIAENPWATIVSEHAGELVVDDFDELLCGRHGAQLRDADCLFLDALEELAREGEVDVGFEEDASDFAQAFLDIGFAERAAPAQPGESRF